MSFDPDKLYLTKAQILGIGDKLIARWKQNEKANLKMILIARTGQFLIKRYSEAEIEQYYKDFWKEAYEIMVQNALEGNKELSLLKQVKDKQALPPAKTAPRKLDFAKALNFGGMQGA